MTHSTVKEKQNSLTVGNEPQLSHLVCGYMQTWNVSFSACSSKQLHLLSASVQDHIYKLMKSDSYTRFLRSNVYQDLLTVRKKVSVTISQIESCMQMSYELYTDQWQQEHWKPFSPNCERKCRVNTNSAVKQQSERNLRTMADVAWDACKYSVLQWTMRCWTLHLFLFFLCLASLNRNRVDAPPWRSLLAVWWVSLIKYTMYSIV